MKDDLILCFGTFAKTLNLFRTEDISQKEFIAKMVEVIDPKNMCKESDRHTKKHSAGNGPIVAKLLKCEYNFKFSDNTDARSKLLNELEENEKHTIQNISSKLKSAVCNYVVDRAKPFIIHFCIRFQCFGILNYSEFTAAYPTFAC